MFYCWSAKEPFELTWTQLMWLLASIWCGHSLRVSDCVSKQIWERSPKKGIFIRHLPERGGVLPTIKPVCWSKNAVNVLNCFHFLGAFPLVRDRSGHQWWIFGKLPKRGGDNFQSKNTCCRFWTYIYRAVFGRFPRKIFLKWRGEGQRLWKFICFGTLIRPLEKNTIGRDSY